VTRCITVIFFFGNNANSENQQKTNVKPVTTKTRKRNQRDISDKSTINSTSHLAGKYTDATSKELSLQLELLVVEVREVGDNSLYRADLFVVGQSWLL
jgi:DNA gyrase/topoisomerase IV subunit B